jgi:acyl-CoA thioesterase FadM
MYLLEEAALQHLREAGVTASGLYDEQGLSLEILDSSIRIHRGVHLDQLVRVEVTPVAAQDPSRYDVQTLMFISERGRRVKAAAGRLSAACVTNPGWPPAPPIDAHERLPGIAERGTFVADRGALITDHGLFAMLEADPRRSIVWRWRVPYFYCHYMRRLQHSGYLRVIEEIVDLFLESRGLSIRQMLETRQWIPFVSEAQLEIVGEAAMEDDLYTVFTVDSVYKTFFYSAGLRSYVLDGNRAVEVARGRIVHGYARILGRGEWELTPLDAAVIAALNGSAESRHDDRAAAVLL